MAALIGLDLPVEPMARESYVFKAEAEIEPLPFLKSKATSPSGRRATAMWVAFPIGRGCGLNFELDPARFEAMVCGPRPPGAEDGAAEADRSWRGHYASILDYSPIIGPWTDGPGSIVIATGFSGHGIMHAPPRAAQ